tara:strand:- start:5792 stop:21241 length:15450 start_codon:yes stop_codon:yes gene_type:complete
MAYNDDQNASPLPVPGQDKNITASDFLPSFFRTAANKKFLQATLDQLIQPGVAEKINGYFGRTTAKAFKPTDNYMDDVSSERKNYQLEPAAVIKDNYDNVEFYKDYNDYIGQLGVFGGNTQNHSRLNTQETYGWNPNIDWDKFVNFREYYWMPNGPISIPVRGQSREVVSTYTVTTEDQGDNVAYVFNDGLTRNPTLKLYRGQTYRFEIDTPGHPIAFSISRTFTPGSSILTAGTEGIRNEGLFDAALYGNEYDQGDFLVLPSSGSVTFEDDDNVSTLYPDGIRKLGEEGEEVAVAYIEKGTIEFTIPANSPERLYYISKNEIDTSGLIKIYDIEENSFLNVTDEILGKKYYKSANGVELSNGMQIRFQGDTDNSVYKENNWYVEGVGDKIKLVKDQDLIIPAVYSENKVVPFDSEKFDSLPFSNAGNYASQKDYIVINRASPDRNAWSRYNCWHHRDVILKSFSFNKLAENLDESKRASRPIIEFEAGLKLNNFGAYAKQDVDLIDTYTTDAFSMIEGQLGYNIDGVDLADGMRILFTADTDVLVNGKIFQVKFVRIGNDRQISLIETADTTPLDLETILITQGQVNAGKSYHYHNNTWVKAQGKTKTNQQPLFEVCDANGNSFSSTTYYPQTNFQGTKLFSYLEGEGTSDTELGFPLSYRNIDNSGDILFSFNLLSDTFEYEVENTVQTSAISSGYLKKYKNLTTFSYANGFSNTPQKSKQFVVREYAATDTQKNNFNIDVYDNPFKITDLKVVVFVNNKIQLLTTDYNINKTDPVVQIQFVNDLNVGDVIKVKTDTKTIKNQNGYYEFPYNLERNPLNDDIVQFTLGEVIDHVDSMLEDLPNFTGKFLGANNLRDLGDLDQFGKRFVKHSGPINLPLYHITNKEYNIIKALKYAKNEYARFKRTFIDTATNLGYDGATKTHVDLILAELNKDKIKSQPFYFSDMIPYGSFNRIEYAVLDRRTLDYPLTETFTLKDLTPKGLLVYLNGTQITYNKDYNFDNAGYITIDAGQLENDIIEIYEYESSDGSFISPTPTKLGLYPKYNPMLTIDDTVQPTVPVDDSTGPFKVYGQIETSTKSILGIDQGLVGWTYPLYTSRAAAKEASTDSTAKTITFEGLNKLFYIPNTNDTAVIAGNDDVEVTEYYYGVAFIIGHDGSRIKAYKDFRDNLLIELEKRIFNNIKVDYSNSRLDIDQFIGGEFKTTDFTKQEIDKTLLPDFQQWIQSNLNNQNYTNNTFYNRNNDWTFNYADTLSPNGNINPGFWRGVYQHAYDTDRPHSHPWEIQGFRLKPTWWNTVYGPSPYTSDNLVLWKNIEEGKIADPSNVTFDLNYARPGITTHLPVDSQGKLVSPLASGYANDFILNRATRNFKFGDFAPIENAWRNSSEYPFAVMIAMLVNQPAKTMGLGFDVSRIKTNLSGQWTYTETNKQIVLKDLVLPNTTSSTTRVMTSGFVNYIYNLVASDVLTVYNDYKTNLKNLTNQIGIKISGFTSKENFNLILDSRSPTQSLSRDGIFVPQENYKVFLNTSSPKTLLTYSGILVEKVTNGYVLSGYSLQQPYFEYYKTINGAAFIEVTVGGKSEKASLYANNTQYYTGEIISATNSFFKVTNDFKSTAGEEGQKLFDNNTVKLPKLPTTGGRTAKFKKNFATEVSILQYGARFNTVQETVDFILGYAQRQTDLGFEFNKFDKEANVVEDWRQSAKEFMYWTTQGWAPGALLAISPSANQLRAKLDYGIIDSLTDEFYGYSLLKASGDFLDSSFSSLIRDKNSFGISIQGTDDGLYHASLPVIQKEHVVLLDNKTIFNDLIYNPSTGYRQERIRVNGYRSDNWNGGLNIPGFVYDDATYGDWVQWKDYRIGDLVKYKQYYYVALRNVIGTETFNSNFWYKLNEKPESELVPNFDYKINQFADFYDLDTDNFDSEQQRMAQHLIGFQKRQYLANIINDDVSQYKFYRGAIADKGTMNVFTKLFSALGNTTDTLELYEEWAIQSGRFGAIEDIQQIEFQLDDKKMQESPQAFELVNTLPSSNLNNIYRILPNEVYSKPVDYASEPFPIKVLSEEFVKTAGYVSEEDVDFVAGDVTTLYNVNINQIGLGQTIWVTNTVNNSWGVAQLRSKNVHITELSKVITITNKTPAANFTFLEVTTDKWIDDIYEVDNYIGFKAAGEHGLLGLYRIRERSFNKIVVETPLNNDITAFSGEGPYLIVNLSNSRVASVPEISEKIGQDIVKNQKVWVDKYQDDWAVLQNNPVYSMQETLENPADYDSTDQGFTDSIAVTKNNNNLFISAPGAGNGEISVYKRSRDVANLNFAQKITIDETQMFTPTNSDFGKSIDVSPDGEYLAVGIPKASNVKTKLAYKTNGDGELTFDYQTDATYVKGDIVRYRESLWKANREILPQIGAQPFSTFDSYTNLANAADADSTTLNLLVAGNPGLPNYPNTDHMLIRAPKDMYLGTAIGDNINLFWNQRSFTYPTTDNYIPFDGEIPELSIGFITAEHAILEKIDHIMYVDTFVTLPAVGQRITTDTGSAEVDYVAFKSDSAVIYLKNSNGIFDIGGELYINDTDFVGFYTEEDTYSISSSVAGYWKIATPPYNNNSRYYDVGRGLVYADIKKQNSVRDTNLYYNVQATVGDIGVYVTNKNRVSFLSHLSYRGDPSPADAQDGVEADQPSNKWVVRVGKQYSDSLSIGATPNFDLYQLDNRVIDVEGAGLSYDILNKQHTIIDIWDGYIDMALSEFDFNGFAFQPQVGDVIEDVQVPADGQGGLALTTISTSTAQVVFVQRNFNNVRVYVKVLTGDFVEQSNIGKYDIRRKANTLLRGQTDSDRVIATIDDTNNNIVLQTSLVGKLLVFEHTSNFDIVENPEIIDEEYAFFTEIFESGIERAANSPYSLNKDYTQVYNIPALDQGTTNSLTNEGAVAIYRRLNNGGYRFQNLFVSEHRKNNKQFGNKVRLVQSGNYYTLLVGSKSQSGNPGSIEIFRHGVSPQESFAGVYRRQVYSKGDIILYKDDFYIAIKDVPETMNDVLNSIYWNKISWRYGKDTEFMGEFDNTDSYRTGNVVSYNSNLWKAVTNIDIGANNPSDTNNSWILVSTKIDYLGYLPNITANNFYGEETFNPQEELLEFSENFDVSDDSNVLVVTAKVNGQDSTTNARIVVYREVDNKYVVSQVISAPNTNIENNGIVFNDEAWAKAVSLSPDGTQLAIGSPLNDNAKTNQGEVYIWTQNNAGVFEMTQTLTPPSNEESEKFGFSIDFGQDDLLISSLNGDQKIPTSFDITNNVPTTFDKNFTSFRNTKLDKGIVYVYENINNTLVYGEQFVYPLTQTMFGENVYSVGNHAYIGVPQQYVDGRDHRGILIDYRKPPNTKSWNVISQGSTPTNVKQFAGAFIYNKRSNRIISYIDYIDPIQGKIAGPADQEISYKLPTDPALYNTGLTSDPLVDADLGWTNKHIGKVWWDLSKAKFVNPYQGTTTFQKNNWNKLTPGATILICEWVESVYLPDTWDQLSGTPEGYTNGVSGTSLYGNTRYSTKIVYDETSKTFGRLYYFWVTNKRTVPNGRNINTIGIAELIANPRTNGYKFISFLGKDKFVLNNCDDLINGTDSVLQIKYHTTDKPTQNYHNQYKLFADGSPDSVPEQDLERKWFDSLIGFDIAERAIPDPNIPLSMRYGIQSRPRQSMFVNRIEALKQTIERINLVLKQNLITDEYNLTNLLKKDDIPTSVSQLWDLSVDSIDELEYISTNKILNAQLTPIIVNGRLARVRIDNPGRGYKSAPKVVINGTGKDAIIDVTINNLGQVTEAQVIDDGSEYNDQTTINVRPFTVLVTSDIEINGKWALYSFNNTTNTWYRKALQSYDTTAYWEYIDWYADGFNQFTPITTSIEGSYQLFPLEVNINDVVKINNVGSGGWLLLRKVADEDTEDYTVNYETIGRQNGTIQFKENLYNYNLNSVGFDNRRFDNTFYDINPSTEIRNILEAIRDNIFIGSLKVEYNQLFMSTIRYVLAEQSNADWLFKTSFVKAKHIKGTLNQNDITFNNDNLQSYQDFVEEFKPYKTKLREFVSNYDVLDNTSSLTTDFDLSPAYSTETKRIESSVARIQDGVIVEQNLDTDINPRQNWKNNIGQQIVEIKIGDGGSGWTFEPIVKIQGGGGTGAEAKAYLGYGKITHIKVTEPGSGYTSAPTVIIEGSQTDNSTPAKVTAVLGGGLVRSTKVAMKFDRNAGSYTFDTLDETETFTGTGARVRYDLGWPMDLDIKKVEVYIDNVLQLRSKYTFTNIEDTTKTYDRERGRITFTKPPALNAAIQVKYKKPISLLSAEDRIKFAYQPGANMFGKELSQLLDGIDYGGVEIRSFDFSGPSGWDTQGWYTDNWDVFENTFEDEVFTADGSTIAVQLSAPLEANVVYNLYKNGVRIDAPDFVAGTDEIPGTSATNVNAITSSITGDGITDTILVQDLGISLLDGDVFVVRKSSSDGSIGLDPTSYDTQINGGDLVYSTATGLNAEDIVVDGDGFVTPTTSKGPEELVPGQVIDTLDIKVYTRDSDGQGQIFSQSYIMDSTLTYSLGVLPSTSDAVFVKLNNQLLPNTDYTVNWTDKTITFASATVGAELNIIAVAQGIQSILDFGTLITDGTSEEYTLPVKYVEGMQVSVTVDGTPKTVDVLETETVGLFAAIRFDEVQDANKTIHFTAFGNSDTVNYSQITKDTFTGDGTLADFELLQSPFYSIPTEHNLIVKVNNTILKAGYNVEFVIPQTGQKEFAVETFQHPSGSLEVNDIKVFLNGVEKTTPIDWRFEISNSSIILADDVGTPGDVVDVFVITDGDYRVSGKTVTFDTPPALNDTIEIYQFSNHNLLDIDRINYDVVSRKLMSPDELDYVNYIRLTTGEISLRSPAPDAQYVWVSVNNELLTPSVDYYVTNDGMKVRLIRQPSTNDKIDVIHFTAPVSRTKFAFRQFKDMLNRTHFKRLDKSATTLANNLNYHDLRIEVEDASNLSEPNKGQNLPGIIFIDGERIEYFVKENNTLRQLRRGTLGTGVKNVHTAGSKVFDQNIAKTVPYADATMTHTFREEVDGVQTTFAIPFTVDSVNEVEVFVGGIRQRKNTLDVFDPTIALDSPEGNVTHAAEFTVNANALVLSTAPADGISVTVTKKQGRSWTENGISLGDTENSIARFLRAGTTELPE